MNNMSSTELGRLITNPVETLDTEYKSWLQLETAVGKAQLVRSCLALRNYNGGYLVIGVQERDGKLQRMETPDFDVRSAYTNDRVCQLVMKYCQQRFEVITEIVAVDGVGYPVIRIESGVRTPAISNKPIYRDGDATGDVLLQKGLVYVRTLTSNHSISTAPAEQSDWEDLMRRCMDNREADIGNFIRRHLTVENISSISQYFSTPVERVFNDVPITQSVLDDGRSRFLNCVTDEHIDLPEHGSFEVGFVFTLPNDSKFNPNQEFLQKITAANPNFWSGWPMWFNLSGSHDEKVRPRVVQGAWEASIITIDESKWRSLSIDFWVANPWGRFYHQRGFWEDHLVPGALWKISPYPNTVLDIGLQITHVAEALVIGQAFAKAMKCDDNTIITFQFAWKNIKNRTLISSYKPNRLALQELKASDISYESKLCFLPVGTAVSAIHQYVREVVAPLCNCFSGYEPDANQVQYIVDEFLMQS